MLRFGGVPSYAEYTRRFGSLFNAYELIGYKWKSKSAQWRERIRRRQLRTRLLEEMSQMLDERGIATEVSATRARFWIGNLSCYFQLSTRSLGRRGRTQWLGNFRFGPQATFRLLGRLGRDDKTVMDYYLVPDAAISRTPLLLSFRNVEDIDVYRAKDLATVVQRLIANLPNTRAPMGSCSLEWHTDVFVPRS